MQTMQKLRIFSLIFLAGWIFSAHAANTGDEYSYARPSFKVPAEEMPKSTRTDDLTLAGGIKVPAYSVSMVSGAQEGFETFKPETSRLNVRIKPEFADQLAAYATPKGTILVPRNWSLRKALHGADGSTYMLFAPDDSGQSYLSISDTGACVGCAETAASLYFDEARKQAKDDEFSFFLKPHSVRAVRLNRFQQGYNIKVTDGNPVDGIASFDPNVADGIFFDVQISAPANQHSLATFILDRFKQTKKSK